MDYKAQINRSFNEYRAHVLCGFTTDKAQNDRMWADIEALSHDDHGAISQYLIATHGHCVADYEDIEEYTAELAKLRAARLAARAQ